MKILVLGCVMLTALWGAPAGSSAQGKEVFDKSCKMCHGADGHGNPGLAKVMKVEFKHLGSKEVQAKTDAEIEKIITQGYEKMKPVKGLSQKQLDDVVAYVRTLKP